MLDAPSRSSRYYRIDDGTTSAARILIRDDGSLAHHDGAGRWVESGSLARWMGPGADNSDDVVAVDDVPAVMAELDALWGANR